MPDRRSFIARFGAAVAAPALAGIALPSAAPLAQTTDPLAPTPSQAPVLTPPPASPIPAPPAPPAPARPGAAASAIDKSKTYFVFFDLAIDVLAYRLLRRQLSTLVEAGVPEINLVVSSPGGLVFQALSAYSFIRALPATVNTHASSLVASAANILFLAGQNRSADRNARFFFHATQGVVTGNVSGADLQNRLGQFAALDAMEADIYHDRTRLPNAEIARFEREEVFYTPDQAQALGIVQDIADLHIPAETSRIVFIE